MRNSNRVIAGIIAISFVFATCFPASVFAADITGGTGTSTTIGVSSPSFVPVSQSLVQPTCTTIPEWLRNLSTLTPDDAAAKINAYVTDTTTAKNVAAVLGTTGTLYAALVIGSDNISAAVAAKVLAQMTPDAVAKIFTCQSIAYTSTSSITTQHVSVAKQAAILTAMDSGKAGAILGSMAASGSLGTSHAANIMYTVSVSKAAELISKIPSDSYRNLSGPAIAAKILSALYNSKQASILANSYISVSLAAQILAAENVSIQSGVLSQMDAINKYKADQIRLQMSANAKVWLAALGTMTPSEAATKIAGYVRDNATAQEVANALSGLSIGTAALILGYPTVILSYDRVAPLFPPVSVSPATAAQILSCMDAAKAASILAYTALASTTGIGLPAISTAKADAILLAMPIDKAAAVLGAFVTTPMNAYDLKNAIAIINGLTTDKIAALLAKIPGNSTTTGAAIAGKLLVLVSLDKQVAIMSSGSMPVQTAANILGSMSVLNAAAILPTMDNSRAAAIMAALPPGTAWKILFAQNPLKTEPAVTNMKILYILERMSPDSAAKIIDSYCAANPTVLPARVEQIFRKEVPSVTAKIFASSYMSVTTAGRILKEIMNQGFTSKAIYIMTALTQVNKPKADLIASYIGGAIPLTPTAMALYLYKSILGRSATLEEITVRTKDILSGKYIATLATEFFSSPEFIAKSPTDKIAALYRVILGRAPDAGGLTYWTSLYKSGQSLSSIASKIIASPEFVSKSPAWKNFVLDTINIVNAAAGDKQLYSVDRQ